MCVCIYVYTCIYMYIGLTPLPLAQKCPGFNANTPFFKKTLSKANTSFSNTNAPQTQTRPSLLQTRSR